MASKLIFVLVLLLSSFILHDGSLDTFTAKSVVEEPYRRVSDGFAGSVYSEKTLETFTIFPTPALGPESLVFASSGEGPYTGVSDGRILKFEGPEIGFVDFAYASPNRTKTACDGTAELQMGPKCGRPLGLGFNHRTSELYVADAYNGLCIVGPKGGLAKQLAIDADGVPIKWTDAVDVDQRTEIVYFTDVSTKYSMTYYQMYKVYHCKSKEVKELMSNLEGAGGVAVSKDSSFVLVSEYMGGRIQKYWLTGRKAGDSELFISIPAPANMKRTLSGDFLVSSVLLVQEPSPVVIPRGVRISESGAVLEIITLSGIYNNSLINEVQEYGDSYYVGSIYVTFAAAATKI